DQDTLVIKPHLREEGGFIGRLAFLAARMFRRNIQRTSKILHHARVHFLDFLACGLALAGNPRALSRKRHTEPSRWFAVVFFSDRPIRFEMFDFVLFTLPFAAAVKSV